MGDPSGGPIEENGGQNGDNTEPSSLVGMGPPSPLTGCYLLIIIGEPHSAEHKDIILQRLVKGLLSWDAVQTHVDLEDELNTITVHAPEGEDARHGERLIQYASENLVTEILIHPQYNTLIQCMRNLLSSFTRHRHIIHAGYTFSGNGSWILQITVGSEEVASAIPIPLAGYKTDPMKTSVYGKLPESEPKQYDEYASSGPDSSSCVSQESARSSSDHRFLDEADLDFEKALEEHRQVRGSNVMSSVTSKYEFSPSKEPLESGKTAEFPLSGVQKGKSFDSKSDQPTTSEVQTKTEEELLKEEVEARVLSWGKPLGLPSPVPVESQTTPKRERKLMISKTKMNNEKNLRKRSESPIKGKKVTPIYMDLTYVPHNGNSYYSHVEFFKRIRARSGTKFYANSNILNREHLP